jgi:hypothetical protein
VFDLDSEALNLFKSWRKGGSLYKVAKLDVRLKQTASSIVSKHRHYAGRQGESVLESARV